MDVIFKNLIDSKTQEPLILENVDPKYAESLEVWRLAGKEMAKRFMKMFKEEIKHL